MVKPVLCIIQIKEIAEEAAPQKATRRAQCSKYKSHNNGLNKGKIDVRLRAFICCVGRKHHQPTKVKLHYF